MKNKIISSLLSLCFILFFTTWSTAQSSGGGNPDIGLTSSSILLKENRQSATEKSNVVKIGFFGLFGLDPHLAYERVLTEKTSINLNIAFIGFKDNLPFTDIEGEGETTDFDLDTKLSIFTITPEYRIYVGRKGAPRGFYLGPYLRYARYSYQFATDVDIDDDNGNPETVQVDIDGTMTATGMGFQMGVQWIINDIVSIDWGFFGIGFNRYLINVTGRADGDNVNYAKTAAEIEEELEDIPFIGKRVNFDTEDNSIQAKIPFFGLAVRTNLKVGIMF